MKFYNRDKELALMKELDANRPSFLVLTGKRRVGKTELIKHFLTKHDKAIYLFVDNNKSPSVLLKEFESQIKASLELPEYVHFDTFDAFFELLLDRKEDLVVAFDEFQRFQTQDRGVLMIIQKLWDLKGRSSRLFLIVSGSSIGMIKRIFIETQAPLFKRADNMVTLKPFTVREIFKVLSDLGISDPDEKLDLYTLFGGTIYYYQLMEKYKIKGFEDALDRLILSDLAPLRNEIRDILIEEFGREHATYYEILSALALGKATKKDIADSTHIEPTSLSPYLYDLMDLLEVAEHVIPVGAQKDQSKRGRYFLKDNFFRFYFRFIYPHMSEFQLGKYKELKRRVLEQWPDNRGRILEDICLEFVQEKLSGEYPDLGRYWDRTGTEIEIVGMDKKARRMVAIEVKSKDLDSRETDRILTKLSEQVINFRRDFDEIRFGVIARTVKNKAALRQKGILCWDFQDLFGRS